MPEDLLQDLETGQQRMLDTSRAAVRQRYEQDARRRAEELRKLMLGADVDLIEATTDGGHIDELVAFFRRRRARRRA